MTEKEIAIRVRNIVSERSQGATMVTLPHIYALVPTALEGWSKRLAQDPEYRAYLLKNLTATVAAGGTVDLANYLNGVTAKISLKELRNATVYTTISGVRTPLTWVGSQQQLTAGNIQGTRPAVFLDGSVLRTRDALGSLTGLAGATVEFTALNYPANAAAVPEAIVHDFVLYLADLVAKEKIVDGG